MSDARKTLVEEMGVITPPGLLVETLDSAALFAANEIQLNASPIDQYLDNIGRLVPLYRNEPMKSAYRPEMGKLVLLGYMSAVESFLRALIRRLVVIDEHARKTAEPLEIQYAAALHHTKELLPEALLENVSLAGTFGVCKTLDDVCGVSGFKNGPPAELKAVFSGYDKICQLRHCCVHRFGRLGARNAQRLGMDEHSALLEKQIRISQPQLDEITAILQRFVASINNFIFADVLRRSVERSPLIARNTPQQYRSQWSLDFTADSVRFTSYYELFACTRPELASPSLADLYDGFVRWAEALCEDERRRRARASRPT